jgi:RNA polymerase sigma-70 factor (ECF subfamily)
MSQSDTAHKADEAKPSALAGLPDEELVARARGKNVPAFEELLGRYENKLYRLAMRFVRNENDAQEILQEALLSAWRNLPGFEGRAQFGSWMYRVTANAALMFLRARNRHPEVMLDDIEPGVLHKVADQSVHGSSEDWSQRPDEQFQSEEMRRHIQTAVDALPEGLRTVFLVRDVEGLSTEETAELLGLSLPAVKTRLHRARLALREAIGQYFTP